MLFFVRGKKKNLSSAKTSANKLKSVRGFVIPMMHAVPMSFYSPFDISAAETQ